MAQQVASLYATLALKDDLSGALRRAGGDLQSFGGTAKSVTSGVLGAFKQIALMAGAGLGLSKGISVASDFQSTLAEVKARTGASADEMKRMSDFALKMGADTAFSGQQAADAMLQLMTSGQDAKEAMETLPSVLNLAAAGGLDLAKAADGVTDVMAAFGISGKAAAESVADSMARAAGTSSATADDLMQGFKNVGPIAKQFGMNVEDTSAVLALFSENGIKGAEAGTQLKSMLTNLSSPTARKELNRLGVSMFDLQGKTRPMSAIISDIGAKMKTMTDEQRISTLKTLGGAYGQLGLAALTSGMGIDEMIEKMRGSASAADVAAARMNTFRGATNSLMGSIETLAIKALTPLMEKVLTPLVQEMTKVVNKVGEFADDVSSMGLGPAVEKWFNGGMDWLKKNGPDIFEGALKLAFTWRGEIVKWVTDNGPKILDGISAWFTSAWEWVQKEGPELIKGAIKGAFDGLGNVVTMIATVAPSLVNAINAWFGGAFAFIEQHGGALISYAIEQAFAFLKDSVAAIAKIAPDIWEGIEKWFGNAWDALKAAAPEIVETAFREGFKLIREFGGWLIKNGPDIIKGITDWFKGAFNWILTEGAAFVGDVIKGALNGIGEAFGLGKIGDDVKKGFEGIFGEGSPVRTLFEGFKAFVSGIFDAIGAIIRAPIELVQNLLGVKPEVGKMDGNAAEIGRYTQGLAQMRQAPISQEMQMTNDDQSGRGNRAIWAMPTDFRALKEAQADVDGLKAKFAEFINSAAPSMTTFLQTTVPGLFTIAFGAESAPVAVATGFLGKGGILEALIGNAGEDIEKLGVKAAGIGDAIGAGMAPVAQKMTAPVAQGVRQIGKLLSSLGGKSGFFSELGMVGALLVAEADKLEGRAMGGPMQAGKPYMVGELGPELVVPRSSGYVVPNHALGGAGGGVHIGTLVLNGVQDPAAMYDAIQREARKRNHK